MASSTKSGAKTSTENAAAPALAIAQIFPWHAAAVSQLRAAWSANRLPHALLLQGPDGLGKRSLAAWLTAAVLCDAAAAAAMLERCGCCASCKLLSAGSHPDLLWVSPEEDKQQIAVDQARAATERLSKTSYRRGYKIVSVAPAHQMTPGAANALLKTLEEPPPQSLLILITSRPSALPATVRSRCQKITVYRPRAEAALQWLQTQTDRAVSKELLEFAAGAPLRALEYAERFAALNDAMLDSIGKLLAGDTDVTQVGSEWAKDGLAERLLWLDLWLSSLARAAIGGSADLITFPQRPVHLPSLPRTLNISATYALVDRLRALKAQLARTALQRELAIESWLIALLAQLAPASASRLRT